MSFASNVFPSDSQLMVTALINIKGHRGNYFMARVLLDSCSTVNLITEEFAKKLNLTKQPCSISIGAVDSMSTVSNYFIKTTFQSTCNSFKSELNFLVVPKITDNVPNEAFPRDRFKIPKNINLADPRFHVPAPVDVLLASNTTLSVLSVGQIRLNHEESQIVLQKTILGWVVAGGSESLTISSKSTCNVIKLDKLLERFWVIEEIDHEPLKSRDDIACERHYVENTKRDESGRYIVRFPFRDNKFELGHSRKHALQRFYALERKFESNPVYKEQYSKAMDEYITLGHMTLCEDESEDGYYIPHHAVIKESSETTKFRPVFDASARTSTGISLNDVLMPGPTIQDSIFKQILRFRTHRYVVTADIEKMYRQILIHPDDKKYQKIFWYYQGKIRIFYLLTVTFGVSCAPFLAIRTLHQLALDEAKNFPRACKLLTRDFYVDDFISGADSIEEILNIRDEMIQLLSRGGFVIRQWASNQVEALENISKEIFNLECGIKNNSIHKTLGIIWDCTLDQFIYLVKLIDAQDTSTKRKLASEIAKIYDPLGLLGPVILYAKVLIQDCWKAKITWDESLPQTIHTKWISLADQLPCLREFSTSRCLLGSDSVTIEVHGFCDASDVGYGACLFIKSVDNNGVVTIKLACSKSRVAPISGLTIPRAELSAATVLKRLYVESKSQFEFPIDRVVFWSDSTIVLCWLKKAPHLLRTFEANKVAEIQSIEDQVEWRYVRSKQNPADALSRGQLPSEFLNNSLWVSGPEWLSLSELNWPLPVEHTSANIPGLRKGVCLVTSSSPSVNDIFLRFSKYQRLVRVIAYIRRWKKSKPNNRCVRLFFEITDYKERIAKIIKLIPSLLCSEVINSERCVIKLIQHERFSKDLKLLENGQTTRLDAFSPFIDEFSLIRVGGRLKKSKLVYNQKYPLLLPAKHYVSDLIIRDFHERCLHAGIQSTLYATREYYWIQNGKNQVTGVLHRCVECVRQRPRMMHAKMADLPESRITESSPFRCTGVDFFGPFLIKEKKARNKTFIKTYGCVFVCMSTKAVHIELAIDMSSQGFLAAFRRFVSRRGLPEYVYSDNGTNFVGANRELLEIYKLFDTSEFKKDISNYALSNRIEWHFNPPVSPHFGGLWEAAVKSFKHHLKRIMKEQHLTYEQLYTLLVEIEAILNSRPLCSISSDPNDPLALTPAHVLIGRPFNFLPSENLVLVPDNRLSTYKFIIKARQDFWNRWHKEYLNELQMRTKWQSSSDEVKPGSVIALKDDNLGCARWPLGVILKVKPGSDGISRVASVKTATGIYDRNITRLCVLPIS